MNAQEYQRLWIAAQADGPYGAPDFVTVDREALSHLLVDYEEMHSHRMRDGFMRVVAFVIVCFGFVWGLDVIVGIVGQ